MKSIAFPKMFSVNRTLLLEDHDATLSNLKLLLASDRGGLFGDPYYGCTLKRAIFEQNNRVLRDLIIDEIYTAIRIFMPQLKLTRNNITITSNGIDLFARINCINLIDYQVDLYDINLTSNDSV